MISSDTAGSNEQDVQVTVAKEGWRRGGSAKKGPGELQEVGKKISVPRSEAERMIKKGYAK